MIKKINVQCLMMRTFLTLLLLFFLGGGIAHAAFDVTSFDEQPQGYHLGSLNFWNTPYFANFLAIDTKGWIDPDGWSAQ